MDALENKRALVQGKLDELEACLHEKSEDYSLVQLGKKLSRELKILEALTNLINTPADQLLNFKDKTD